MLCIGIDIGCLSHACTFISDPLLARHKKAEHCPRIETSNTASGFDELTAHIQQYGNITECCALVEPTGHYGILLLQHLKSLGVQLYVAQSRERKKQQSKSDTEDSLKMAKLLYNAVVKNVQAVDNHYRVSPLVIPTKTAMQLHGYVQRYIDLDKDIVRRKNQLKAISQELFPESVGFYGDHACPSALSLWQAFPTPSAIASASLDALLSTRNKKARVPSAESFAQLQEAARKSIGQKDQIRVEELVFRQNQLIEELIPMLKSKAALKKRLEPIVQESREGIILTSFIGINITSAAIILDKIKDVEAFPSAGKFKSFFGWSPQQNQSGKSLDHVALTRRGNRDLKRTMRMVAMTAIVKDPTWEALYERLKLVKCYYDPRKKKQMGKMKVIGRIIGQMITLIYRLLKRDRRLINEHQPWGPVPPPETYRVERHIVQGLQASAASRSA